jgi:aspartokinase/homoserine dehydrogenase 1
VGLIGSTLLKQIEEQHQVLKDEKQLDIRIVGVANSRKMLSDREGLNLENWKNQLDELGEASSLESFAERMISNNLENSVLVDCTANPNTRSIYPMILGKSMSISTANKVAASSSQKDYDNLINAARRNNAFFLNETNVGAGLPVLATLQNMVESGDKIKELKAVISGSLSYIFNHFNGEGSFTDLVKEARSLGFTEPDPREDLSGNDIKRKIIILARVAGFKLEPEEVIVEPLLPKSCMDAPDVDSFFVELEAQADYFDKMIKDCLANGTRLRYVASYKDGQAKVSLERVDEKSPFYNLASTDNMIVIHSDRYATRPLTIAGPGAGADVTAAGVFAELIQLGNLNHV